MAVHRVSAREASPGGQYGCGDAREPDAACQSIVRPRGSCREYLLSPPLACRHSTAHWSELRLLRREMPLIHVNVLMLASQQTPPL